ncbi:hypothetical protein AB1N83_009673 [Pleurotus pulmonarius]
MMCGICHRIKVCKIARPRPDFWHICGHSYDSASLRSRSKAWHRFGGDSQNDVARWRRLGVFFGNSAYCDSTLLPRNLLPPRRLSVPEDFTTRLSWHVFARHVHPIGPEEGVLSSLDMLSAVIGHSYVWKADYATDIQKYAAGEFSAMWPFTSPRMASLHRPKSQDVPLLLLIPILALNFTMVSFPLISLLFAASAVIAAPGDTERSCNIANAKLKLPSNQTALANPSFPPAFITVALGIQNYTCTDAGTFTSVGAVAELFDISCLVGTSSFDTIQNSFFTIWSQVPNNVPASSIVALFGLDRTLTNVGEHYFITNPITGSGLSPKWDFTSRGATSGNRNAFVVGARAGGIPAPTGPQDVDWLQLTNVQGRLADEVFRVDTRGGQPPASCTPGSPLITVKYTSKYWLFGGSL